MCVPAGARSSGHAVVVVHAEASVGMHSPTSPMISCISASLVTTFSTTFSADYNSPKGGGESSLPSLPISRNKGDLGRQAMLQAPHRGKASVPLSLWARILPDR